MKTQVWNLKAHFALLLLMAAAVLTYHPSAAALPRNEIERWYFADSSLGSPIGWSITLCDGSRARWGDTTSGTSLVVYTDSCSTSAQRISCIVDGLATTCPSEFCKFGGVVCTPQTVPCTIGGDPANCAPTWCDEASIDCHCSIDPQRPC